MVQCIDCKWAKKINNTIRLTLSQENKEIVNILERRRILLDDFCFCEKLGFIESKIVKRECNFWNIKKNN